MTYDQQQATIQRAAQRLNQASDEALAILAKVLS